MLRKAKVDDLMEIFEGRRDFLMRVIRQANKMVEQGFLERKNPLKPAMSGGDEITAIKSIMDRGYTDHAISMNKVEKNETKEVNFESINCFLELKLQLELDFVNKIDSFNSVGMTDPFEMSLTEASAHIESLNFFQQVYPESVIIEMTRSPRCIFLP